MWVRACVRAFVLVVVHVCMKSFLCALHAGSSACSGGSNRFYTSRLIGSPDNMEQKFRSWFEGDDESLQVSDLKLSLKKTNNVPFCPFCSVEHFDTSW